MHPQPSARIPRGRWARAIPTLVVVLSMLVAAPPAQAATPEQTVQTAILAKVNAARVASGLRPLRADAALGRLAVLRARWMAERRELTHDSYGGSIDAAVTAAGVQWLRVGENVARSSGPVGSTAADVLFEAWRSSPPHWAAITSRTYNYIGVGVAFAAPSADPFAALVFTESYDRTPPVVSITSGVVSGTSVRWTWRGSDVALQTHTATVCDFDIQYRVDAGAWRLLRSRTAVTAIALASRPRGHTYAIRVRARDCAGNISAYTAPRTLRVR